jgi:hypothetical protein
MILQTSYFIGELGGREETKGEVGRWGAKSEEPERNGAAVSNGCKDGVESSSNINSTARKVQEDSCDCRTNGSGSQRWTCGHSSPHQTRSASPVAIATPAAKGAPRANAAPAAEEAPVAQTAESAPVAQVAPEVRGATTAGSARTADQERRKAMEEEEEEEETPLDPQLVKKWNELKSKPVDALDFVKKLAPNWAPGELLPELVLFEIYKNKDFEQNFTN